MFYWQTAVKLKTFTSLNVVQTCTTTLDSINGGQPSFQSDGYRSVKPNEHCTPGTKLFRKPAHPRVRRCTLSLPLRRIRPLGEKRCDKDKRFSGTVRRRENYISTLPFNFNWWVISHTQTFPQKFKTFLSQWFGQNISNLLLTSAML